MLLPELLRDNFHVSGQDLEKALKYQQKYGGRLEQVLVNMGSLPDDQIPELLSQYLAIPLLDLMHWQEQELPAVDSDVFALLSKQNWLPLKVENQQWTFACTFPLDLTINEWLVKEKINATLYIASESEIQALQAKFTQHIVTEG